MDINKVSLSGSRVPCQVKGKLGSREDRNSKLLINIDFFPF